jgi:hypothetical protein
MTSLIFPIMVAIVLGLAGSWVDFHVDEPTVLCAFVMLCGAACGAAFGLRRSWPCGIVLGASLPIYYLLGRSQGFHPHWPPREIGPNDLAAAVTIVSGTIGVLIGAAVHRAISTAPSAPRPSH